MGSRLWWMWEGRGGCGVGDVGERGSGSSFDDRVPGLQLCQQLVASLPLAESLMPRCSLNYCVDFGGIGGHQSLPLLLPCLPHASENDAMSTFLKSLQEAKMDDSGCLHLHGVYFPCDDHHRRSGLYVRDCYKEIFEIIKKKTSTASLCEFVGMHTKLVLDMRFRFFTVTRRTKGKCVFPRSLHRFQCCAHMQTLLSLSPLSHHDPPSSCMVGPRTCSDWHSWHRQVLVDLVCHVGAAAGRQPSSHNLGDTRSTRSVCVVCRRQGLRGRQEGL